jgi:hypothetical protein
MGLLVTCANFSMDYEEIGAGFPAIRLQVIYPQLLLA